MLRQITQIFRKIIGELHKNIIDGKLALEEQKKNGRFAAEVFKKIQSGKVDSLRKYIIQNEIEFNNNYHSLLRDLFNVIDESSLDFNKKRVMLLIVANAMGQHSQVLDPEINAFSCILELSQAV